METNIIAEEIFKVLKANRAYRKALKYTDYEKPSYRNTKFGGWFTWEDQVEGVDFWVKIYNKVCAHLESKCSDPKFRLGVYEYLLTVFEKDCSIYERQGFCHESGSLLHFLPELNKQEPKTRGLFWWDKVSGKDVRRCCALLEAIRLVKLKINDSETLSTPE